ncbi:MAG: DUF1684 domain-containing protein [Candidatus Promineifilaceae bacterium]|nr:DUF1684 domain-containing protein [Candidatus Promineifilaceae bacterium]
MATVYAAARQSPEAGAEIAWRDWRAERNGLFQEHPQSPLNEQQRARFRGLAYYPYDPAWRLWGRLDYDVKPETMELDLGQDGRFAYTRIALTRFAVSGRPQQLAVYWVEGYGGGLFLPFGDATNGKSTFGGGRYLYDTIKGADLGVRPDGMLLDFNFAYNPSCAYHSSWVCPLPPRENRLTLTVNAGEKLFDHGV